MGNNIHKMFMTFRYCVTKLLFPHEQFHPLSASSAVSIFFVGCCAQQSLLDPDILLFYVFQSYFIKSFEKQMKVYIADIYMHLCLLEVY